ncbi:hypothetical protein BT69DRAFT_688741 [Atractiella rhizophila]|nr:hypothetical protein BT69DRAFT_688741 [Atractiella rhizophila]
MKEEQEKLEALWQRSDGLRTKKCWSRSKPSPPLQPSPLATFSVPSSREPSAEPEPLFSPQPVHPSLSRSTSAGFRSPDTIYSPTMRSPTDAPLPSFSQFADPSPASKQRETSTSSMSDRGSTKGVDWKKEYERLWKRVNVDERISIRDAIILHIIKVYCLNHMPSGMGYFMKGMIGPQNDYTWLSFFHQKHKECIPVDRQDPELLCLLEVAKKSFRQQSWVENGNRSLSVDIVESYDSRAKLLSKKFLRQNPCAQHDPTARDVFVKAMKEFVEKTPSVSLANMMLFGLEDKEGTSVSEWELEGLYDFSCWVLRNRSRT